MPLWEILVQLAPSLSFSPQSSCRSFPDASLGLWTIVFSSRVLQQRGRGVQWISTSFWQLHTSNSITQTTLGPNFDLLARSVNQPSTQAVRALIGPHCQSVGHSSSHTGLCFPLFYFFFKHPNPKDCDAMADYTQVQMHNHRTMLLFKKVQLSRIRLKATIKLFPLYKGSSIPSISTI